MPEGGLGLWRLTHFQHYFSYIVAFSFIGGGMLEGGNLGFNNNLYHYRTVNFDDKYI